MREKNALLKEYMTVPEIFVELADGYLFHGNQVLAAKGLKESDTDLVSYRDGREKKRDVLKYYDDGIRRLVIGIENQSEINYAMAVRTMVYDGMTYESEIKRYCAELEQKGIKLNPVHGGIKEMIIPEVVTIILYVGKKPWDGPMKLSDMLDCAGDDLYFNNYRLYVIDVRHLSGDEIKQYNGDIRILFTIVNIHEKGKPELEETALLLQKMTVKYKITYDVMAVLTKDDRYREFAVRLSEETKEETQMCALLDYIEEKGMEKGMEKGINAIISDNVDCGVPWSHIVEKLQRFFGLDEKTARQYVDKYSNG